LSGLQKDKIKSSNTKSL